MIQWVQIENALHAAVVAGSGLAATNVVWAQQEGKTPAGPWISLRFRRVESAGLDFLHHEEPATPEADPVYHLCGYRRLTLQITQYNGAATGVSMPVAIIDGVRTYAAGPAALDSLGAAGIGSLSFSPTIVIDGIANVTDFEPRAVCDATFLVPSDVVIPMTTIRSVELTGETPEMRTETVTSL